MLFPAALNMVLGFEERIWSNRQTAWLNWLCIYPVLSHWGDEFTAHDPPPLGIPLGLWPAYVSWGCTNLTKVNTFVFSALLHSSNSPLNINLICTLLSLMSTIFFPFFFIWRLSAVGFNKFVYLTIDISAENKTKKWVYSEVKFINPLGIFSKVMLSYINNLENDPCRIGVFLPTHDDLMHMNAYLHAYYWNLSYLK